MVLLSTLSSLEQVERKVINRAKRQVLGRPHNSPPPFADGHAITSPIPPNLQRGARLSGAGDGSLPLLPWTCLAEGLAKLARKVSSCWSRGQGTSWNCVRSQEAPESDHPPLSSVSLRQPLAGWVVGNILRDATTGRLLQGPG